MHKKLFIPGPVEVHPDVLKAMSIPMISHRGKDYQELHSKVKEGLRRAFGVKGGHFFLFTSSATGAMEASLRNLVARKVLVTTCGAFSERWFSMAAKNGKEAQALAVEWGRAVHAESIAAELKKGGYDAVTVTHSETSTGVLHHLDEIGEALKATPEVMFLVDAVSSMAGVPIDFERWGIDMIFAGVQKAWGMPPGLTVVWVSERALDKAARVPNRGHYFDLLNYKEMDSKNETPETPVITLVSVLGVQLERMLKDGMPARYARVREKAQICRQWALQNGFKLFPEPGYEGLTLTTVENSRGIDISRLNSELGKRGYTISDGYGKLKGKTFRIAHMGDITPADLRELLGHMDEILKTF
jgi:aspartate aminotransferase-like enzyme